MSSDLANITNPQKRFELAWFRFPVEPDENIQIIEVVKDILLAMGLILNVVLLWMIWKNPDKKPRNNRALLLINLCIVNLAANIFGSICSIENRIKPHKICTYKASVIVISIILPTYYPSVFLLTLTQYALIVKPMEFKSIDPRKMKTTKIFVCIHWIVLTAVLIITPIFIEDFDKYFKVVIMVLMCSSWIATAVMAYLYTRTLHTLWKRNNDLKKKFNVSMTQQGTVIISQNTRLTKVLLVFIVTLVLFTLPSNTAYLFILYCPECDQRVLVKVCLYTLPLFLGVPAMLPIHWIIGTPQYYKELKKQIRKLLLSCRCVKDNGE